VGGQVGCQNSENPKSRTALIFYSFSENIISQATTDNILQRDAIRETFLFKNLLSLNLG
jgi:anaerobic ribonucleoside-triphosphate reductase